jgi:hypothetical protein
MLVYVEGAPEQSGEEERLQSSTAVVGFASPIHASEQKQKREILTSFG